MNNTTNSNCFIGADAGKDNTSGYHNAFVGYRAGYRNTVSLSNTFVGSFAGAYHVTGHANSYFGSGAGFSDATGTQNVYLGYKAGYTNTSGNSNVFIGYKSGYYETGSNKLYIDNSNTSTPLIYGDFANDRVGINKMSLSYTLEVGGDARADNWYTTSDARLKKDLKKIGAAMDLVNRLEGLTYEFKNSHTNAEAISRELPRGKQYGFAAQKVQEVLPELVKEDVEGYLAVNYTGVIPVLVEALKEKDTEMKALETRITKLEALLAGSTLKSSIATELESEVEQASLFQNQPNPFSESTTIRYNLPASVQNAQLIIYDMQGNQLKAFQALATGSGSVAIAGSSLEAGMYIYTLLADGQEVATKRMILVK